MGSHHPAEHYNRVHRAWTLIMGEEFHYGYFEDPATPLERATSALTEQMQERAEIAACSRILDVGCGTGRQACDLAANFDASVLGISTSEAGVAAATDLAEARQITRARFERRDGTDTGLASDLFDVVWVLESSHLMRDKTSLLHECSRVLVPGGRLVLCDIIRKREMSFPEVRSRRNDLSTLRAAFGDAHMEPLEQYALTLEAWGMTVTDRSDISTATLPTLPAWRANVVVHEPTLCDLLGTRGAADFVEATHILEAFWHDETLGYGILAAVKGS